MRGNNNYRLSHWQHPVALPWGNFNEFPRRSMCTSYGDVTLKLDVTELGSVHSDPMAHVQTSLRDGHIRVNDFH
jgi:hypothetical protein